jgi:hypothetical protein
MRIFGSMIEKKKTGKKVLGRKKTRLHKKKEKKTGDQRDTGNH